MDSPSLPFEVGQSVEARSFIRGFRGAWFRCKIKTIGWRNNGLGMALEYPDFPDEKVLWTKVYQKESKSKYAKQKLMIRPCFPSVYHENQMPDLNTISEVVVVVNNVWRVGDLVDSWTDHCYWSGRITERLGDEKVKIELPPPPVGEGSLFEAFCKDLRPSLDWSVDEGWKLLPPMESKYQTCCAQIVKPLNLGISPNLIDHAVSEGKKDVKPTAGALIEHEGSLSSHTSAVPLPLLDKSEQLAKKSLNGQQTNTAEIVAPNIEGHGPRKTSCSDSVSSSHVQDASAQMPGTAAQMEKYDDSRFLKKMKIARSICLNSTSSDTIEAAILDFEELICWVKWLKHILERGTSSSDMARPSWKFVEHRATSKPK